MEDFVKVNVAATNRHHGALVEVGAKARNLSKTLKDGGKVLHIVLGWSNEDRRIIGVSCVRVVYVCRLWSHAGLETHAQNPKPVFNLLLLGYIL
jgi:hypothetical protein